MPLAGTRCVASPKPAGVGNDYRENGQYGGRRDRRAVEFHPGLSGNEFSDSAAEARQHQHGDTGAVVIVAGAAADRSRGGDSIPREARQLSITGRSSQSAGTRFSKD